MSISTILLLIAVVLFAIRAANIRTGQVSLTALGLAFFAGSFLVAAL